ncbi:hypothetical protein [Pseudomonas sp. BN607]|uniref:hypothetical protein n=1 Tax=Pseudomonas sp. BN607 TaxID=2567895 RepID=UPI002456996F|nr:hypothetical protein [Pseudomonas sp. BN607]
MQNLGGFVDATALTDGYQCFDLMQFQGGSSHGGFRFYPKQDIGQSASTAATSKFLLVLSESSRRSNVLLESSQFCLRIFGVMQRNATACNAVNDAVRQEALQRATYRPLTPTHWSGVPWLPIGVLKVVRPRGNGSCGLAAQTVTAAGATGNPLIRRIIFSLTLLTLVGCDSKQQLEKQVRHAVLSNPKVLHTDTVELQSLGRSQDGRYTCGRIRYDTEGGRTAYSPFFFDPRRRELIIAHDRASLHRYLRRCATIQIAQ